MEKRASGENRDRSAFKAGVSAMGVVLAIAVAGIGLTGCPPIIPPGTTTTTAPPGTTTTTIIVQMIAVTGGTFDMGCDDEEARDGEKPEHAVTVSSFQMSRTEITQAQYLAVQGENPSFFNTPANLNRPVEMVSWFDAVDFCNKLSALHGLTPVYTITNPIVASSKTIESATVTWNFARNGYRLPTEAEWEYAAGGGSVQEGFRYSGSDVLDSVAWWDDNSDFKTHAVAGKTANRLGLYDMTGNVAEWCNDWYGEEYYSVSPATNPTGPATGDHRVIRGGAWINTWGEYTCRVTNREEHDQPSSVHDYLGFRIVRR